MAPSIAIVGAGPAGLTLAALLQKHDISFTLFDLRPIPSSNEPLPPSGSLDLHPESGLRALDLCGLTAEFQKLTREGCEDTYIANKNGEIVYEDVGSPEQNRPEIDRAVLTDMLLRRVVDHAQKASTSTLKFGHKLLSISPINDKYKLEFANHDSETFDLVVGADGAWSKVRSALTDVKPEFSTVSCLTLTIPHINNTHPDVSKVVGRGNYWVASDGKALMAQRGGVSTASSDEYVRMYIMLSSPKTQSDYLSETGLASLSTADLKHQLLHSESYFASWSPQIRSLIAASSEEARYVEAARALHMMPIGATWPSKRGLTLLGDAAHLMTPFAGEGVNAAMLDAIELYEAIVASLHSSLPFEDVTRTYEHTMFVRAEENAQQTWEGLQAFFAPDAPQELVEMFESHGGPPPET